MHAGSASEWPGGKWLRASGQCEGSGGPARREGGASVEGTERAGGSGPEVSGGERITV